MGVLLQVWIETIALDQGIRLQSIWGHAAGCFVSISAGYFFCHFGHECLIRAGPAGPLGPSPHHCQCRQPSKIAISLASRQHVGYTQTQLPRDDYTDNNIEPMRYREVSLASVTGHCPLAARALRSLGRLSPNS